MTVDSERIASVVQSLPGRTVCAECAEVFIEVLDAVRATAAVPVPSSCAVGVFAVSTWGVETAR
jgi:hypothetical protein